MKKYFFMFVLPLTALTLFGCQQSVSDEPTEDQRVAYRSDALGIQFEYPGDWVVKTLGPSGFIELSNKANLYLGQGEMPPVKPSALAGHFILVDVSDSADMVYNLGDFVHQYNVRMERDRPNAVNALLGEIVSEVSNQNNVDITALAGGSLRYPSIGFTRAYVVPLDSYYRRVVLVLVWGGVSADAAVKNFEQVLGSLSLIPGSQGLIRLPGFLR